MSLSRLKFPMNLYAAALQRRYGVVPWLCYGHVQGDRSAQGGQPDLQQAQRDATERLVACLGEQPLDVLVLTRGPLGLAESLKARGHSVTSQDVSSAACRQSGQFDCIVVQDCLQVLDLLEVLVMAETCLCATGRLLISDEFAVPGNTHTPQSMVSLPAFLRIAGRTGFAARVVSDNTAYVRAFLPLLSQLMAEFQQQRVTDPMGPQVPDSLLKALEQESKVYAEGVRVHNTVELRHSVASLTARSSVGHARLCSISQCTAAVVKPLFECAFDTEFDAALWHWKYGDGRGQAVGIVQDGQLIAHYGGMPRDVRYFGQNSRALQICDVMVLPQKRGFYSRSGHFFRTAATLLDLHVGYSARHLLGFGFPNLKAMRVACRLGLYEKTDELIEIRYPQAVELAAEARLNCQEAAGDIFNSSGYDLLWQAMARALDQAILGDRSAAYMCYRYLAHPSIRYRVLQLRDDAGRLVAVAVLRDHEGELLLCDIVAVPADIVRCLPVIRQWAGDLLKCWIAAGHAHWFEHKGSTRHTLGIEIPCNRWSEGPGAAELAGAWWLQAGDMDFL